ncbi:MAG: ABC transporter [Robiginitomaculum sp.]|nr:MAG: ABC transporter [Robiginitomaculum sp.]
MSSSPVIAFDKVCLTLTAITGPVPILRSLDLSVEPGEHLAIVGPSGSGKTSLISVAAGLERATSGTVNLLGRDIGTLNEDALARLRRGRVGFVFQSFHLLPNMTALENVAAPLEIMHQKDAMAVAQGALEQMGLADRLSHYPAQLSGGEKQRVAVARALAPRPEVIFADEPTGNLDSQAGAMVADLIFDKCAALGAALVLVTHDAELAGRASRIITMQDGRIV